MRDRKVVVQAEQFIFGKLVTGSVESPQAVIARSPGISDQEAWRVLAEAALGTAAQLERIIGANCFLCTRGWAVAVLYQAAPALRGARYLTSHCVLLDEHSFRQLGSNFRCLTHLLPKSVPLQQELQRLPLLRQEVQRSVERNVQLVQRALDEYGIEALQRLLEPYFTGSPVAHVGFKPEMVTRLDFLEVLALLVPPFLRRAMSFTTEAVSLEECALRTKFVPRPMAGLRSNLVVLWDQSRATVIGGCWEQDRHLRRCCTFLERFIGAQSLSHYLAAVEGIEPADEISRQATPAHWANLLTETLVPLLTKD